MKMKYLISAILGTALLSACENSDINFPDFDYQTVSFANQYAMRTIELGSDEKVDLTPDNMHQASIIATWGGGYGNRRNVLIEYMVDPSIVDGLYFKDSDQRVEVMPEDYYSLADERISIPAGKTMGGITVKLTDKFFADPKATGQCYVIPVRMTRVEGADSILSGTPAEANPVFTNDAHWSVQPKNFVLYGVKYVNPWHGQYLRRGTDKITVAGTTSENIRKSEYVENDEVVNLSTSAYMQDILPLTVKDDSGNNMTVNLVLTFDENNNCTVSSSDTEAKASGSGRFVSKGEKNSLGGKDRDAIYLDYTVELPGKDMKIETSDILVLRSRNVYGAGSFSIERK